MKVAFMASDSIALECLKFLRACPDFQLACVVSNPDRPKGRGKQVQPNDVSLWAISEGIELLRPEKPDESVSDRLREIGVELIIVMAYGSILRDNILNYGKYPCLNVHPSALPLLRGASPVESAIALGMKQTSVSLMRVVKKMDSGAVCAEEKLSIDARETSQSLREKVSYLSAKLLRDNLVSIITGDANFVEQDDSLATYTRKFFKDDLLLDFNLKAREIDSRIRAFGGGIFEWDGKRIKVGEAFLVEDRLAGAQNGEVLECSRESGLRVACAESSIRFTKLQRPCAKMLSASDFFLSQEISVGKKLKSFSAKNILK